MKFNFNILGCLCLSLLLSGCALDILMSSGSHLSTDESSLIGIVSTVANYSATNFQNGSNIGYLAVDTSGNLYSGDIPTKLIKKITPGGTVSNFADTTSFGAAPNGLAMGPDGFLYAYLSDGSIAKISPVGTITIVASNTDTDFSNSSDIGYITVDSSGNVYASDQYHNKVKKIAPNGTVSVYADVTSITCTNGLAFGNDGYLYAYSCGGDIVRIAANGAIQVIADYATANFANDSAVGYIALDSNNNVYASDTYHHVIKKIAPNGAVTVIAGSGADDWSGKDGPALSSPLTAYGLAFSITGSATLNFFDSSGSLRQVR
ncbi:MAG: SMP-30/gluconolactonase/LRE family protein [Bdellovibrio sp.]